MANQAVKIVSGSGYAWQNLQGRQPQWARRLRGSTEEPQTGAAPNRPNTPFMDVCLSGGNVSLVPGRRPSIITQAKKPPRQTIHSKLLCDIYQRKSKTHLSQISVWRIIFSNHDLHCSVKHGSREENNIVPSLALFNRKYTSIYDRPTNKLEFYYTRYSTCNCNRTVQLRHFFMLTSGRHGQCTADILPCSVHAPRTRACFPPLLGLPFMPYESTCMLG